MEEIINCCKLAAVIIGVVYLFKYMAFVSKRKIIAEHDSEKYLNRRRLMDSIKSSKTAEALLKLQAKVYNYNRRSNDKSVYHAFCERKFEILNKEAKGAAQADLAYFSKN